MSLATRKFIIVVLDNNKQYNCVLQQEMFDTRESAEKAIESEKLVDRLAQEIYFYIIEPIWL